MVGQKQYYMVVSMVVSRVRWEGKDPLRALPGISGAKLGRLHGWGKPSSVCRSALFRKMKVGIKIVWVTSRTKLRVVVWPVESSWNYWIPSSISSKGQ